MLSVTQRPPILWLAIVTAVFAIYAPIVDHPFHAFDDPLYVTNNYYVQQGLTWSGTLWAFVNVDAANWHPLAWLSHMLDIEVWGVKPAGHYLTNILLHALGSVVLFELIRRLAKNVYFAFAVATIWAVHPANVECVAWISQRKSLLSAIFIFAGFIWYSQYKATGARAYYLLAVVGQILAAMSKPIAVLFPVGLVLIELFEVKTRPVDSERGLRGQILAAFRLPFSSFLILVPFIFVSGYLSAITFYAQDTIGATGHTYASALSERVANALESILDYSIKSLTVPESSVLYVLRPVDGLKSFLGALVVVLFVLAGISAFMRRREITVGAAWYLLTFLPTIGLIQVGSQRMADRYLHLPLVGAIAVVCSLAVICFRRFRSPVLPVLALAAWAMGLGMQSKALCTMWVDGLTLSLRSMEVGGESFSMRLNGAIGAMQRNNSKLARAFLEPIAEEPKAGLNLALVDLREGKYEDGLARARALLDNKEVKLSAACVAGQAFEKLGRADDANRAYRGAMGYLPKKQTYILSVEQLRMVLPELLRRTSEPEPAEGDASPVHELVVSDVRRS